MTNKNKLKYEGIEFDSEEEIQFYIFLRDAKKLGLIIDFSYQPKSFLLVPKAVETTVVSTKSGKQKLRTKVLYREHSYTADFWVKVNPKVYYNSVLGDYCKLRLSDDEFYVDVKGGYNRFGGDRIFPIHQKLVFWKYHKHVNKVVPSEFFQDIGYIPEELRWIKGRRKRTLKPKYSHLKSLDTILTTKTNHKNIGFLPDLN